MTVKKLSLIIALIFVLALTAATNSSLAYADDNASDASDASHASEQTTIDTHSSELLSQRFGTPKLTEAHAACVMDESGAILWSDNADVLMDPASITKIMTAMVALDQDIPFDRMITLVDAPLTPGAQAAGYKQGDVSSFNQLMNVMLVYSANDAAYNVGVACSGSEAAFVEKMNEKAAEIGMTHTHFCNTHGLMAEGHQSTARDLTLMGRYAMQHYRFIRETVHKHSVTVRVGDEDKTFESTDELLGVYQGLLGIKTGRVESGCTFLGAARRSDIELFSCVLGCATPEGRFRDTEILLNWAYNTYDHRQFCKPEAVVEVVPYTFDYRLSVPVVVSESGDAIVLPNQELSSSHNADLTIDTAQPNEALGAITLTQDDHYVATLLYRASNQLYYQYHDFGVLNSSLFNSNLTPIAFK